MRTIPTAIAVLAVASCLRPAQSQTVPAAPHSMMPGMARMEHDMAAAPMTGDPDQDFVAMMIPHHRGAIDMARYELAHGRDPALLKLARAIVSAQNREIAAMRSWQVQHPRPMEPPPSR